jgi:hypothetical protein
MSPHVLLRVLGRHGQGARGGEGAVGGGCGCN